MVTYEQFKTFLTEEELNKRMEEGMKSLRKILRPELEKRPLSVKELCDLVPEDLEWVKDKRGFLAILGDFVETRIDTATSKTYYGLKNRIYDNPE